LGGFEPFDPPPLEPEGRGGLRDRLAFPIGPQAAEGLDDALTGEGGRPLVDIAGGSWVGPGGAPLGRRAAERAVSVCVPGLLCAMLPPELSEELCSLRPNVDRLCVTVEIPLPEGEPTFYRSVIRSSARLTYGQVESILAGREQAE